MMITQFDVGNIMTSKNSILTISGACKEYKTYYFLPHIFSRPTSFPALDNVSLSLHQGEILGIIGESGSGKTTLGKSIINLNKLTRGTISLFGRDVTGFSQRKFRPLRKSIQMIFQDLDAALNPNMKIKNILQDIYHSHHQGSKSDSEKQIINILESVYLNESILEKYPTELSGGQKRRVSIAGVLLVGPKIIIADEPTSGLDAHVQRLIMHLLLKLQSLNKLSMVLISHDLSLIQEMCQRIIVMYQGSIVETGTKDEIFQNTAHPYTQQLVNAQLQNISQYQEHSRHLKQNHGNTKLIKPTQGCMFSPHCSRYLLLGKPEICTSKPSTLSKLSFSPTHNVKCYFPL